MISDTTELEKLTKEWSAVKRSQAVIEANTSEFFPLTLSAKSSDFVDLCFNLLLVYAYAVLNNVLDQFRKEGHFSCDSRLLGALMDKSQHYVPWLNFPFVDQGRERRNDIAHRLKLVPRADCLEYINAIELELVVWRVIGCLMRFDYTITFTPRT